MARRTAGTDRSSVTPVITATAAVACLAGLGVLHLGRAAVTLERAQATADVTALAAVVAGDPAAEAVAAANGADLEASGGSGGPGTTRVVTVSRAGVLGRAAAGGVRSGGAG